MLAYLDARSALQKLLIINELIPKVIKNIPSHQQKEKDWYINHASLIVSTSPLVSSILTGKLPYHDHRKAPSPLGSCHLNRMLPSAFQTRFRFFGTKIGSNYIGRNSTGSVRNRRFVVSILRSVYRGIFLKTFLPKFS